MTRRPFASVPRVAPSGGAVQRAAQPGRQRGHGIGADQQFAIGIDQTESGLAAQGHVGVHHRRVAFGQKTYNGVAILSRLPFVDSGMREWCGKADGRHAWAALESSPTDDEAGLDVECCKQCRGAMAFVVVGHGGSASALHR